MTNNDRFWHLLARQLAADISTGELEELNGLLNKDPSLQKQVDRLAAFWNLEILNTGFDPEASFKKLWDKINNGQAS